MRMTGINTPIAAPAPGVTAGTLIACAAGVGDRSVHVAPSYPVLQKQRAAPRSVSYSQKPWLASDDAQGSGHTWSQYGPARWNDVTNKRIH